MLKYIILDVDGTLTDGGVYYDNTGNELKKFCTKDGTGIIVAQTVGIKIVVLTGRECKATTRRLKELGVSELYQGVKNKVEWLKIWFDTNSINKDDVGYIGDDINDLAPMKLCGYIGCPADACNEVKEIADYVSPIAGGHGAARDVIEHYLKDNSLWNKAVAKAYGAGV